MFGFLGKAKNEKGIPPRQRYQSAMHRRDGSDSTYETHNTLGKKYTEQGKFQDAIQVYEELLSMMNQDARIIGSWLSYEPIHIQGEINARFDAVVNTNLGKIYVKVDNIDKAILSFENALKIDPTYNKASTLLNLCRKAIMPPAKPQKSEEHWDVQPRAKACAAATTPEQADVYPFLPSSPLYFFKQQDKIAKPSAAQHPKSAANSELSALIALHFG
jgi:tetratricopeptide (TPR) repeat protein